MPLKGGQSSSGNLSGLGQLKLLAVNFQDLLIKQSIPLADDLFREVLPNDLFTSSEDYISEVVNVFQKAQIPWVCLKRTPVRTLEAIQEVITHIVEDKSKGEGQSKSTLTKES